MLTAELAAAWLNEGASESFRPRYAEFVLAIQAIARGDAKIAVRCDVCKGDGKEYLVHQVFGQTSLKCTDCHGTGWRLA